MEFNFTKAIADAKTYIDSNNVYFDEKTISAMNKLLVSFDKSEDSNVLHNDRKIMLQAAVARSGFKTVSFILENLIAVTKVDMIKRETKDGSIHYGKRPSYSDRELYQGTNKRDSLVEAFNGLNDADYVNALLLILSSFDGLAILTGKVFDSKTRTNVSVIDVDTKLSIAEASRIEDLMDGHAFVQKSSINSSDDKFKAHYFVSYNKRFPNSVKKNLMLNGVDHDVDFRNENSIVAVAAKVDGESYYGEITDTFSGWKKENMGAGSGILDFVTNKQVEPKKVNNSKADKEQTAKTSTNKKVEVAGPRTKQVENESGQQVEELAYQERPDREAGKVYEKNIFEAIKNAEMLNDAYYQEGEREIMLYNFAIVLWRNFIEKDRAFEILQRLNSHATEPAAYFDIQSAVNSAYSHEHANTAEYREKMALALGTTWNANNYEKKERKDRTTDHAVEQLQDIAIYFTKDRYLGTLQEGYRTHKTADRLVEDYNLVVNKYAHRDPVSRSTISRMFGANGIIQRLQNLSIEFVAYYMNLKHEYNSKTGKGFRNSVDDYRHGEMWNASIYAASVFWSLNKDITPTGDRVEAERKLCDTFSVLENLSLKNKTLDEYIEENPLLKMLDRDDLIWFSKNKNLFKYLPFRTFSIITNEFVVKSSSGRTMTAFGKRGGYEIGRLRMPNLGDLHFDAGEGLFARVYKQYEQSILIFEEMKAKQVDPETGEIIDAPEKALEKARKLYESYNNVPLNESTNQTEGSRVHNKHDGSDGRSGPRDQAA